MKWCSELIYIFDKAAKSLVRSALSVYMACKKLCRKEVQPYGGLHVADIIFQLSYLNRCILRVYSYRLSNCLKLRLIF